MRTAAGLHSHQARRQLGHALDHPLARQPPLQNYPSLAVNTVKLKNILCQVDPDRRNLHFRTLPSILLQMVEATILAR
jgi:hypothetical protein